MTLCTNLTTAPASTSSGVALPLVALPQTALLTVNGITLRALNNSGCTTVVVVEDLGSTP